MRRCVVLIVVVGAALALPPRGFAVGHVVLDVSPTRVGALADWRLSARVVGGGFYRSGDAEIFGVTLSRSFTDGRGHELHALRAAPRQTVTFDGERGRWNARFGDALKIRMDITAGGTPRPVDAPLPCRGTFAQVPVTLRGTFALRTGTSFFGTIRRVALRGVVTFDPAGGVDCTPQPSLTCGQSTTLSVSHRLSSTADATLLMSPDENGWTTLSFADRSAESSAGYTWYHVMYALGVAPFSSPLPTIVVNLPSTLPIQGSGTFTAQEPSTVADGTCTTVSATGAFSARSRRDLRVGEPGA